MDNNVVYSLAEGGNIIKIVSARNYKLEIRAASRAAATYLLLTLIVLEAVRQIC